MDDLDAKWPTHFLPDVVRGALSGDSLTSICVGLEAWRRGLKVTFQSAGLQKYSIHDGDRTMSFDCALPTSVTSRTDALRLREKSVTNDILAANGIPVPRAGLLDASTATVEEVLQLAEEIGYPLVLKPNTGSVGRGVMVNLRTPEEVEQAFNYVAKSLGVQQILLESFHSGADHRLLVVGDEVVAACRRIPANVQGDGATTVKRLIEIKNMGRKRNPFLSKGLIRVDREVRDCLHEQDLVLDSVPAAGQTVYLRKVANASAGGDVEDVTESLPKRVLEAAVNAVRVMPNIVVAGVDILYDSSTTSNSFVIIEMNRRPHIGVNMYPSIGTGRDVPKAFVDYFFPASSRRSEQGDELLRFNPRAVRRSLLNGVAEAVTISALPNHRYPYRRIVTFDVEDSELRITPLQENAVLKAAVSRRTCGILRRNGSSLELSVAARSGAAARLVIEAVTEVLGTSFSTSRPWESVVTTGFAVEAGVVRPRALFREA